MKMTSMKVASALLILSSVAVAAGLISKDEVNMKVAAITAPYNDASTVLHAKFTDLNVDAVRALDFGLAAFVLKKGTTNELKLHIKDMAYHYGNGQTPTVTADVDLKLDLLKMFDQKSLNDNVAEFPEILKNMAAEYTQKYGAAVTVDAQIENLQKDANGDVENVAVLLAAKIDFSQLPANLKAEDVEFQSFQGRLNLGRKGAAFKLTLIMNPLNKSFQQDQPGVKELIEKLLTEDADTYKQVSELIDGLNAFADSIVNADPNAQH